MPGMAAPRKQAETFIGKDIAAIFANRARPTFSYCDFSSALRFFSPACQASTWHWMQRTPVYQ